MNFLTTFYGIQDLQMIGIRNCDTAQEYLNKAKEASELGETEALVIEGHINQTRQQIPLMADNIRAKLRQFAQLCKDPSIEAMLQYRAESHPGEAEVSNG